LALMASLSAAEKQRLATLEADLSQDPKRAAARVADQNSRLANLVAPLRRLAVLASAATFLERDRLKIDRDAKAEAAKIASEALFAASPLPEIGQATFGRRRVGILMRSHTRLSRFLTRRRATTFAYYASSR
jgi:hypothetical protein